MNLLKQSTAYTRTFTMYQTDHVTVATGKTVTVNLSKAGAAFAAAGGTVTEISNGWYKIVLTTTDTNTLGDLSFRCTAASCDDTNFVDQVYVRTVDDLAFPATSGRSVAVDTNGALLLQTGTGTGQLDFTTGVVKANATQLLGGTIPSPNVTGVPLVDLKYTLGTISPATAGSVRADAVTGAVGSLTTNNDKTGYAIAVGGIGSGAIASAEKNNIADACLDRRLDVGTDSSADTSTGRTWRSALRQLRNKVAIVAGVATTYKEDDATTSHTSAITTTAGNPISTVDPT